MKCHLGQCLPPVLLSLYSVAEDAKTPLLQTPPEAPAASNECDDSGKEESLKQTVGKESATSEEVGI